MSLTDVTFIQDIFVPPVPLRQSLAPRGSLSTTETSSAECFVAMYEHLPQLELYGRVVEDMERWSAHAAEVYALAEKDALSVQPSLFREFVEADEEIQRELVGHLKRYQRHCRAKVCFFPFSFVIFVYTHTVCSVRSSYNGANGVSAGSTS